MRRRTCCSRQICESVAAGVIAASSMNTHVATDASSDACLGKSDELDELAALLRLPPFHQQAVLNFRRQRQAGRTELISQFVRDSSSS